MGLSRVPSSLLLSPEGTQPGHLPTGSFLVAEVRKTARARMMGLPALRREYGTVSDLLGGNGGGIPVGGERTGSLGRHPSSPTKGVGHGGQKLHPTQSHPPASFTTPPSHLTRPPRPAKPPPSASTAIFPTSSPIRVTPDDPSRKHPKPPASSPEADPRRPLRRLSSPFRPNLASPRHPSLLDTDDLTTPQNEVSPGEAVCPKSRELSSSHIAAHLAHSLKSPSKARPNPLQEVENDSTPAHNFSPPCLPISPRSRLIHPDHITAHVSYGRQSPSKLSHLSWPKLSFSYVSDNTMTLSPARQMMEEDARSEISSDLEIQPPSSSLATPRQRATSHIQTLLYARDSPGSTRKSPEPSLKTEMSVPAPDIVRSTAAHELPYTYTNLLALHTAVERAILLHLATEGGGTVTSTTSSPRRTPSRRDRMRTPEPDEAREGSGGPLKTFRLANFITWPSLRPIVERGSGKRFTETELAQLLWMWQGDELSDQPEESGQGQVQRGMGFTISCVRALDPFTLPKRLRLTYGFGIEITARENPQLPSYTLCSPGQRLAPESPSRTRSPGRRPCNGMNVIALWSSQVEERKSEVARRLREHWRVISSTHVTTEVSAERLIPALPMATLPSLVSAEPSCTSPPVSPVKKRGRVEFDNEASREVPPRVSADRVIKRVKSSLVSSPAASTTDRAMSLMERIKAKQAAAASCSEAGSTGKDQASRETKVSGKIEALRRKSMLSRMPEVIESIYMLFVPDSGSSSRRKPAINLNDLASQIAKSSRIALADGEAMDAIRLLSQLCPDFLTLRRIGTEEWAVVPKETDFRSPGLLTLTKEKVRRELL